MFVLRSFLKFISMSVLYVGWFNLLDIWERQMIKFRYEGQPLCCTLYYYHRQALKSFDYGIAIVLW